MTTNMVALKPSETEAYVARRIRRAPSCWCSVRMPGSSANARAIMRASVDDPKDPFSLVRLDGDALCVRSGAPGR